MQGAMQAKRIAVAVERAETTTDNFASETRQARLQALSVHDLGGVFGDTRLVVQSLELLGASFQLCLRERKMEATRSLEADIEPGLGFQACGKLAPGVR